MIHFTYLFQFLWVWLLCLPPLLISAEKCQTSDCLLKQTSQNLRRTSQNLRVRREEPLKPRLSFANLRDFITQLRASSSLSRESLDNIKANIENLKVFDKPDDPYESTGRPSVLSVVTESNLLPVTVTRRPPYMFQDVEDTANFDNSGSFLFTTTTPTTTRCLSALVP